MHPPPPLSATVALARDLVRRESVSPRDGGCQQILAARLQRAGFNCRSMPFGEVSNLWARHGDAQPLLVFAGHTDVVPAGPESWWRSPPFAGDIVDGALYGRGAADMKGGVAAMVVACEQFALRCPGHAGSIALLITSDEEDKAEDGTAKVVEALTAEGEKITWCVVGEPSCAATVGDTVKVGRRGSLGGRLTVDGKQGHVAYPQLADNPVHRVGPLIAALVGTEWDRGNGRFPPTAFQISNISGGTGAHNVIPGSVEVWFNFRYAPTSPPQALKARLEKICREHLEKFSIHWESHGEPYQTPDGELLRALVDSVREVTALEPELSTVGGTSDGRFIAPTGAQVVEFGTVNATVHQVDEHALLSELDTATEVYARVLDKLLAAQK